MSQVKRGKSRSILINKSTKKKTFRSCENCKGSEERIKALQNALKEVIDVNEDLRSRVVELEALINESYERILEKKSIISGLVSEVS